MTVVDQWTGTRELNHERSKQWYVIAGSVVLIGAAYGIAFQSLLFSVVCVLMAGVYFLTRRTPPTMHTCTVMREGLLYDKQFLRWDDVEGFWGVRTLTSFDLHIPTKNGGLRELRIQLPTDQSEHVRFVLAQFTTELHDQREHLLDTIIRICKL